MDFSSFFFPVVSDGVRLLFSVVVSWDGVVVSTGDVPVVSGIVVSSVVSSGGFSCSAQ